MKLRTIITAFAASVAVAAPAAAEEQVYYCSSELGTGIYKDEQTGRWRTGTFENIRFTMKFGERTKGQAPFYNRELVLSRDGFPKHFICSASSSVAYHCVQVLRSDVDLFFADDPDPDATPIFWSSYLTTDLRRFELYLGNRSAFVMEEGDNTSMYAGTCETF
jgi:hypothetical protein